MGRDWYNVVVHSSPGDSEGRRLARKKAIHLAEAGRLANVLQVMLKRAGLDHQPLAAVSATITKEEQIALLQSEGRIESRKRFKINSPPPAHDSRVADFLFLDESGKPGFNSPDPVFALAGISMSRREMSRYRRAVNELKMLYFGRTDFTLHEPFIRRHTEIYSFGGDTMRRTEFCDALNTLVERTEFRAFGVAIRKAPFKAFLEGGSDPYLPTDLYSVAIHLLLERYVDYLASRRPRRAVGKVGFESQGPKEDAEHQRDFVELLLNGTQWVPDAAFRHWLEAGVTFTRKRGTDPMELADMFSRDLFEWARGDCGTDPRRWRCFDKHIYRRDDMSMGKFGVKVFPDSDVRPLIESHRERAAATGL